MSNPVFFFFFFSVFIYLLLWRVLTPSFIFPFFLLAKNFTFWERLIVQQLSLDFSKNVIFKGSFGFYICKWQIIVSLLCANTKMFFKKKIFLFTIQNHVIRSQTFHSFINTNPPTYIFKLVIWKVRIFMRQIPGAKFN